MLQRRASQLQMVEVWQQSTDRGGWRDAPQHADVTGLMVPVRQLADSMGRLHQCDFIIEVRQCEWRGAHQRPVARSAASDFVQRRRLRMCCRLT